MASCMAARLIAFVMVGLCAIVLYQSRTDALERTRETSRNVALVAERDIVRNFELYDLSLQAVVEGLKQPEVMNLPGHLTRDILFDRAATAKYLESLLVLDAAGNIVIDSNSETPRKANFSAHRFFTIQRDDANAGLFHQRSVPLSVGQGRDEHCIEPAHFESGRLVCGRRGDRGESALFPRPACGSFAGRARLGIRDQPRRRHDHAASRTTCASSGATSGRRARIGASSRKPRAASRTRRPSTTCAASTRSRTCRTCR